MLSSAKLACQGGSQRLLGKRLQAIILAAFIVLICVMTIYSNRPGQTFDNLSVTSPKSRHSPQASAPSPQQSPYAFVTFLGSNVESDNATATDDDDLYFVATRVLAYQLLHAPETATNSSIPFFVLCPQDVSESKVHRLREDGAIVKIVANIHEDWAKPSNRRWRDVMTKLRLFEMTEFEKVLLLDADMYISKRLDDVFTDNTTQPLLVNQELVVDDEGPLPKSYVFSAQTMALDRTLPYPNTPGDTMSAGFMVLQPSVELFNHYMSILKIENRFEPSAPEQNLLNYAHRRDGPMPWTEITYTWTTTSPSMAHYKAGAASLHEKFWLLSTPMENEMRNLWFTARDDMYAYHKPSDHHQLSDSMA